MPLIEAININKSFGDRKIISDFCLTANSQEMIAITGKSGSGKSTLLNILGLLDVCDTGEVRIHDEIISNIDSKRALLFRRNYIGYIFQNYALIENETVKDI